MPILTSAAPASVAAAADRPPASPGHDTPAPARPVPVTEVLVYGRGAVHRPAAWKPSATPVEPLRGCAFAWFVEPDRARSSFPWFSEPTTSDHRDRQAGVG